MARVMLRPHTILPYFLQTVVMTNFLLFSLVPTNNTTFLFINNDSSHQQFMKVFCKKVCISSILPKVDDLKNKIK